MPRHLGERCSQQPALGLQAVGEGLGLGCGVAPRKTTTGLNWAATGMVLSFSQFTAVSAETPNISDASLPADRRKAKSVAERGQGDRGDERS
jgi:hypothetical protein